MRVIPAIIGLLFLLTGMGLLFAATPEEDPAQSLMLLREAVTVHGIEQIEYEGFYRASLKNNTLNNELLKTVFAKTNFRVKDINEQERVISFRGRFSATAGNLFFYRDDEGRLFAGLNVNDEDLSRVLYAVESVSRAFSGISSAEISTWTMTGSLNRRLTEEEMLSVAESIINQLDGKAGETDVQPGAINVLGYSPHLLPGVDIEGQKVNINFAFKAGNAGAPHAVDCSSAGAPLAGARCPGISNHRLFAKHCTCTSSPYKPGTRYRGCDFAGTRSSETETTRFYAGIPFLSVPY